MDLHILKWPEHDLTIFRKCLSIPRLTIPRHHVYKNSSNRFEIKRVTRDFSGHTVHKIIMFLFECACIHLILFITKTVTE